jgi:small subunit ribosomal protein S27Ae
MAKKKEEKEVKKPEPAVPAKGKKGAPVEEPVEEKKEEKKKEKKSQKERPKSKKKHAKVQIWKLYKVEGNTLKRKNEYCPRCGAGTFLASYQNRKYCGKCNFSEITTAKKDEEKVKSK